MTELTFGNFIPVTRFMMDNRVGGIAFIILVYRLVVGFAILPVVRGIFMQEVFKAANTDDYIMVMQKDRQIRNHKKKMQKLFVAADESGDGEIGWEEFEKIMQDQTVIEWLSAQDL